MENLILGFLTGGSLILAIGPQNLFVIEQGLKKNFIFTITTICAISDVLLIFIGVFIYHIFIYVSVEFVVFLNIIFYPNNNLSLLYTFYIHILSFHQ